jgi:hypothetical protein
MIRARAAAVGHEERGELRTEDARLGVSFSISPDAQPSETDARLAELPRRAPQMIAVLECAPSSPATLGPT